MIAAPTLLAAAAVATCHLIPTLGRALAQEMTPTAAYEARLAAAAEKRPRRMQERSKGAQS